MMRTAQLRIDPTGDHIGKEMKAQGVMTVTRKDRSEEIHRAAKGPQGGRGQAPLIGLALVLAGAAIPPVPKFALLWVLSAVVCFGIAAQVARRVPILGRALQ